MRNGGEMHSKLVVFQSIAQSVPIHPAKFPFPWRKIPSFLLCQFRIFFIHHFDAFPPFFFSNSRPIQLRPSIDVDRTQSVNNNSNWKAKVHVERQSDEGTQQPTQTATGITNNNSNRKFHRRTGVVQSRDANLP